MRKNNQTYIFLLLAAITILHQGCDQETYAQGKRLYEAHCENCHMEDGNGLAKLIPPLQNSDYLKNNQDKIACILRHGQNGKVIVNGIEYNQEMPGKKYTAVQITNITNYINNAWGNDYGVTSLEQSSISLQNCK
jgi:mono/diheme cytochrome c family protein